jgi:hypothetical protein
MMVEIASGSHLLEWTLSEQFDGSATANLDEVNFQPLSNGAGLLPLIGSSAVAIAFPVGSWSASSTDPLGALSPAYIGVGKNSAPLNILVPGSSLVTFSSTANGYSTYYFSTTETLQPATLSALPENGTSYLFSESTPRLVSLLVSSQLATGSLEPLPTAPVFQLQEVRAYTLVPTTLQAALHVPATVTTTGTPAWQGFAAQGTSVSYASMPPATAGSTLSMQTTLQGPGRLYFNTISFGNLLQTYVDGVQQNTGYVIKLPLNKLYTVKWTGTSVNTNALLVEGLIWSPYTVSNNLTTWAASFGLSGVTATADGDPDGKI